jgi:hypothetical protein
VRETDANRFASHLLMPITDFRRQLAGQKVTLDALAHCTERYGVSLAAAVLRWLEVTDERALLVISRDGFILWSRSSAPALRSDAYFRTRNAMYPVPEMSIASGRYGSAHKRKAVAIPPGEWLPREPVAETTIFSDRFDMTISLLQLERDVSCTGIDMQPEKRHQSDARRLVLLQRQGLCTTNLYVLRRPTQVADPSRRPQTSACRHHHRHAPADGSAGSRRCRPKKRAAC